MVPAPGDGGALPRTPVRPTGRLATRSAKITLFLLGMLVTGGMIWVTWRPVHSQNAAPAPSVSPELLAESVPANRGMLIIKGLRLGMDGKEAVKAIVDAGQGNIGTRATTEPGKVGVDILFHDPRWKGDTKGYAGGINFDANDGSVREFFFLGPLSDFLFNTRDLTAEEFALKFINAYNVPNLHVVTFQGKQEWRYESPRGWSLAITQQKQVNVWLTAARAFN